ncbi:MAG TPA: Rieske 2Fe-2S domain-containing protein, partial [Chloroflexota bacterium]
ENELLTQTGPDTPCGELMRRYWQPVALSEELPEEGAPLPLRILGEDLVLFRDDQGRPGLLGLHCSHRGADLSYGRLEDGGLRCIYHGWLYDVQGRCLEQPGEPAGSTFNEKIKHVAYPCVERAETIFAYLGPGEPPEFPSYEFLSVPLENLDATKRFHDCNYLQANEGNIDLSHLSFLHYMSWGRGSGEELSHRGPRPGLDVAEAEVTAYGVRSCKIQHGWDPDKEIRVTEYVLPNFVAFPMGTVRDEAERPGYAVNWHVPIDETHHWKFTFNFSRRGALDRERGRYQTDMADYRPLRNLSNRFEQAREEMASGTYLGMGTDFQIHDKWATEGQGPIEDRSAEHLGALDLAIVTSRQVLLKAIRDLQEGREPANVVRDPAQNHFPIATFAVLVPESTDWRDYARYVETLAGPDGVGTTGAAVTT